MLIKLSPQFETMEDQMSNRQTSPNCARRSHEVPWLTSPSSCQLLPYPIETSGSCEMRERERERERERGFQSWTQISIRFLQFQLDFLNVPSSANRMTLPIGSCREREREREFASTLLAPNKFVFWQRSRIGRHKFRSTHNSDRISTDVLINIANFSS